MRLPSEPRSSSARIETGTSARSSSALGAHAAVVQPAPERAGDDRQHRVVHGAAERVLDLLEVGQPALHPAHAPVRADRHVQRHVRRGVEAGPDHLAEALGRLAHLRRLGRSDVSARPGRCSAPSARPGAGRTASARGRPTPSATSSDVGRPGAGVQALLRPPTSGGTGERSNSTVAMSTPETPSTSAWWVFEISAKRPPSRPWTSQISQSGFERSRRWEKIRPGQLAQLLVGARLRQRGVAHVVVEVEARVVDPERPAHLERREGQLLAVARHAARSRDSMCAENSSRAGGGPSKITSAPTCMCDDCFS